MVHTVRVTEMRLSEAPSDVLCAEGVAASLVICLYDANRRLGAMAHALLPRSPRDTEPGPEEAGRFVGPAVKRLVSLMVKAGCLPSEITAAICGAADTFTFADDDDQDSLGAQNHRAALAALREAGIRVLGEDTGGHMPRGVTLEVAGGTVYSQLPGREAKQVARLRGRGGLQVVDA